MIQYQDSHTRVYESALFRTTSTVIQTPDLVLVVDPTWLPNEIEGIRSSVAEETKGRPVYQLFTHSDYDHLMGYGAFPEATIIASRALAEETDKEEALEKILEWDESYYICRPYTMRYPDVDIAAAAGDRLELGDTRLSFEEAPGHNSDGLITVVECPSIAEGSIIIAGDYLSNVEFPFIYHSFSKYLETLNTFEHLISETKPSILIPGHGDIAKSSEEMLKRLEESRGYLHQLRDCILNNTPFDEDSLWKRYPYRRGIRSFHLDNLKLAKREL